MLGNRHPLGKTSVSPVPDPLPLPAAVLPPLSAPVAPAACIRQQRHHPVPHDQWAPFITNFLNDSGEFVSQRYALLHTPPQCPCHHQPVVVTESAGDNSYRYLVLGGSGRWSIYHRQLWR